MTAENNLRSLIPKINVILSRVISSLATPEEISGATLVALGQDLQQAQIYLLQSLEIEANTKSFGTGELIDGRLEIELEGLRQEKQSLLQDIQRLQQQRAAILSEFFELLNHRLHEVLSQQLEKPSFNQFDSTFRSAFDSLEQDLQRYYESLSQGLERMHRLGQQGEAKLLAYVSQLTQNLAVDEKVTLQWYLGIDINSDGLLMVFSKRLADNLEIYPISWTLDDSEELRLPLSKINTDFSSWFSQFKQEAQSWLKDAMENTENVFISGDGVDLSTFKKDLLASNIVESKQKISLVKPVVSSLVSYLPIETIAHPLTTLVIYGGREIIELALVQIPPYPLSLPLESISLTSLNYGDVFYEQDILCHLIYPAWQSICDFSLPNLNGSQPGIPDKLAREQIRQKILNHPLGESLMQTSRLAKLILASETQFTCALMNQDWTLEREQLNTRILEPLSNKLQAEIQGLLEIQGKNFKDIQQVLGYGSFLPFIYPYLLNKLSNILAPDIVIHPLDESDGRIATGLAHLPLFIHLYK